MRIDRNPVIITLSSILLIFLVVFMKPLLGEATEKTSNIISNNEYIFANEKHLIKDYPAFSTSGNVNVVVEIPAGTNAKWEVDKSTGELRWELKNGKPRIVSYLGYPGNYGMIPRTLFSKELGGDGDPLDVIVIGKALPRGSVVEARAIGVLKLLDDGEQDDKIIAVMSDSELGKISSIEELNREFQGITEILEIWFSNYKGLGKIQSKGYASASEALDIIETASKAYNKEILNTK